MSLRHILLGMLQQPHSGYDIKKEFEKSLRNFWRAELSQIYPLLQKMEAEGLISSKVGASDIGPRKRIYRRAAKGSRELNAWLSDGPVVGTERIGYLAQVYFLGHLKDHDKAITFMEELLAYMRRWLDLLESSEAEWRANDPRYPDGLPDSEFYPQLTLDLGLRKVRANVEWCEDCLERMQKRRQRARAG
ncbi:MAG: PadR family transcriptional regulator [Gammaproteobacteria bacterium]|nr:PadR family transcriptional regulator [Gammaproteobacteria bacterium]